VRLAYLGSPEVAVAPLRALVEAGHDVVVVVTQPDRRRGRGAEPSPTPVKSTASDLGIEVIHDPSALVDRAPEIDLGVVVAFGQLIKTSVLAVLPMVNLHFSLLPRWRGAAPVERALLAGDSETGVCLMRVVAELDAGPVYRTRRLPIDSSVTADELRDELCDVGVEMLLEALETGLGEPTEQSGEVTYAAKITATDQRIDWAGDPQYIHRQIRAGGAWTTFAGRRVKILSADLDDGRVRIGHVQPEGRGAMEYDSWRRGLRVADDTWFE